MSTQRWQCVRWLYGASHKSAFQTGRITSNQCSQWLCLLSGASPTPSHYKLEVSLDTSVYKKYVDDLMHHIDLRTKRDRIASNQCSQQKAKLHNLQTLKFSCYKHRNQRIKQNNIILKLQKSNAVNIQMHKTKQYYIFLKFQK